MNLMNNKNVQFNEVAHPRDLPLQEKKVMEGTFRMREAGLTMEEAIGDRSGYT